MKRFCWKLLPLPNKKRQKIQRKTIKHSATVTFIFAAASAPVSATAAFIVPAAICYCPCCCSSCCPRSGAPVAVEACLLCHVAGRLSLCSDDLLNCVAGIACVGWRCLRQLCLRLKTLLHEYSVRNNKKKKQTVQKSSLTVAKLITPHKATQSGFLHIFLKYLMHPLAWCLKRALKWKLFTMM